MSHIIGVSLMAGIGFSMSIFIANLGFDDKPDKLLIAKSAIFIGSLIAGILGYCWLRFLTPGQKNRLIKANNLLETLHVNAIANNRLHSNFSRFSERKIILNNDINSSISGRGACSTLCQ